MPFPSPTAVEIDRKLRDDFRKRLREYGVSAEVTDPVLAVLFRSFAQQLEALYSDTERIRLGLLDELIAGLGIEKRMARPAQAVVRFGGAAGTALIEAGSTLVGESASGAKISFAADASIAVSEARIAFGLTYEDGALRLMPGIEMPESLQAARPSLEALKTNLGPNPALYLAVDMPRGGSLSNHSFYFDMTPDARPIQATLEQETWCLASPAGDFAGPGILRPHAGAAGVRQLRWLVPETNGGEAQADPLNELPPLPPGFYAGRVYVLPPMPPSRALTCRMPRGMEGALQRVFGREAANLFAVPRTWIRIQFPKGLPPLHTGIGGVTLHAVTVSNVECLNQTVYFDRHGTSIPVGREGGTEWHFVAPLSVIGENETPYLLPTEPSTDPNAGRYVIRNGRIELTPARWPDGKPQSYANLRMWISAGPAANTVGPGKINSIRLGDGPGRFQVANITSAAGGTGSERYTEAEERFAAALLSRDRVVTRGDLYAVVKSFDRRVHDATIRSGLERASGALRRVEQVTLHVRWSDFSDPEIEIRYLIEELRAQLEKRVLHDVELRVEAKWEEA